MNKENRFGAVDLILVLTILIWGVNPTIVKIGLEELPHMTFNVTRLIIAAIVCWIILLIKEKDWKVDKEDLVGILSVGFMGHFVNQYFFITGIKHTTAGNNSLIFATLPLIVTIVSAIMKIEKIKMPQILGSFISFFGIIVVVMANGSGVSVSGGHLYGNIMVLFGTIAWALYTVLNKKYLEKYSPLKLCTYGVTIGAISVCILWGKGLFVQDWTVVGVKAWGAAVFSGAMSIGVASSLWNVGIKVSGGNKTAIYSNFTPLISIACGVIFLHESLRYVQISGMMLVFIGLFVSRFDFANIWRWRRKKRVSTAVYSK